MAEVEATPSGVTPPSLGQPDNQQRFTLRVVAAILILVTFAVLNLAVQRSLPAKEAHSSTTTALQLLFVIVYVSAVIAFILAAERRWPADPTQRSFSRGVRVDIWWAALYLVTRVGLVAGVLYVLTRAKEAILGSTSLQSSTGMPTWLAIIIAVLVGDFLLYVGHRIRHVVPVLWRFHAVHHSQQELNLFTEHRLHPVDEWVWYVIIFLPFLFVNGGWKVPIIYEALKFIQVHVVHANLRTDFGWLGEILVSPHAHRLHHSTEAEHYDTNFGTVFIVWDTIFGTRARDEPYPGTGCDDGIFPHERLIPSGAWSCFAAQLIFPFRRLRRVAVSRTVAGAD